MCNNVVALGNSTADGVVLFGKNSDRSPNEAHYLEKIPATDHPQASTVRCTFIDLPQVEHTYAVMLARPCWTWGAEMGTNEHGLTIGNTAVYTRVPYQTGPGLLGMDLLRLALERARTANEAVGVITDLLETFGQGGNCGFRKNFYYHNSFLIADHQHAWVLETAGRHWIAEQVKDVRATSNTLTITTHYDRISEDMIDHAIEKGWHKAGTPFNFKKSYGGKGFYPSYLWTVFGKGDQRQSRLMTLLQDQRGQLSVSRVFDMLRDHGEKSGADFTPAKGYFSNAVCMHAGFGPIRTDQTTGSMVTHLSEQNPTHWLSGTSAPCTSLFKPVWFDSGLPDMGPHPTGQYNQSTLWWRHENLHREILCDYAHRMDLFRVDRDTLEASFLAHYGAVSQQTETDRLRYTRECFARASELTDQWAQKLEREPVRQPRPFLYKKAWNELDAAASFYSTSEKTYSDWP